MGLKKPPYLAPWLLLLVLGLVVCDPAWAARARPDMAKKVGDRAPIFALASSEDRLVDYDRDYYGQHHLVLTFFPAAFTPV
ncbi:hypothetical protein [Desulfuromonas sp.]|uniref:hypothetical protein n=1 Tax=Desulfuromonas sp. TaxID=892 RepID=UPI0025BFFF4F|nr:hypothetical protein [Desulfuromonas sp.]